MKRFVVALGLALSVVGTANADDWTMSAEQVYQMMQEEGERVLFIDVRDPVEIQFIGFTDVVDRNIPFRTVDRTRWNEQSGSFMMPLNEAMADQVSQALADKGLSREATIVTMCRSGSGRGRPSAEYLRENGFPNAYYVEHGFQGDTRDDGEQVGMRTLNGWQNSGLPWSPTANPAKIHRP